MVVFDSLERSAVGRYLIELSARFQATTQDWTLLTELSGSSSSCMWLGCL